MLLHGCKGSNDLFFLVCVCVFEELGVGRFLSFGILRFGREMEGFRIVCWDQVHAGDEHYCSCTNVTYSKAVN